ncbi:MAG: hypothetical protein RMX96_17270 [Nostoc sp. ChiSLP02]|nr:hypothetical protein [Nostoc sp. DedSLP05]MDZ8100029.1 hypothetical protein [Nostoc sp. DedSLP01]MDZ8186586.1 hypothetical protein [Nostoc sp. ChiSLP02]
MSFFNKFNWNIRHQNSQNQSGIYTPTTSQQAVVQSHHQAPTKRKGGIGSKLIWITILIGIPGGVVWVANLPYPVIRRPVVQNAPVLLLPSYMSVDNHYRQALVTVEQAEQLIEKATSSADLDLGEQKLQQAQHHLDELPTWFVNDLSEYKYWWYDRQFTIYGFNESRRLVGQLEAKVFQEKNAQTLLADNTQALLKAKQQYQQATTATDQKTAIAAWQTALDGLEQIPSQTLAGKTAQNQLDAYEREFKEVVGLAAGNERISALIAAARQFSWQAAKAGQNPPHAVSEWEQIEHLWKEAIERLQEVPTNDVAGYAQAQELLAIYERNLGEVKVRRQAEADGVDALSAAQQKIESLLASIPDDAHSLDRNRITSKLQSIVHELEKVQSGTTAYLKAQELLLSANNKLKQLQAK